MRSSFSWVRSLSLLAALVLAPSLAHAEADAFGTGDGHAGAKTVSTVDEVVNAYAPLTADAPAGATDLAFGAVVGDAAGFAAGDLVLVWRATGVAAADAPSASQARLDLAVVSGGAVGRYELARVASVAGQTLKLTKPLVSSFAKDLSQIVKVPEYTTVDVQAGGSLAALAWQSDGAGFAGGMLAFLATGAVNVNGKLNAEGRGFRGGADESRLLNLSLNCPNEDGTVDQGYAPKGEGVVATEFGTDKGGRGNRSIAAGGGNCTENGGGGGGNFGAGGNGGVSIIGNDRGGRGGVGLDYSLLTRISLGGGGGSGEQKNGLGSGGGAGGGAIFVRGRALTGAGTISAAGQAAENAQLVGIESDGAGGGGAGGSVLLRFVDTVDCAGIAATGGKGGDTSVIGLGAWGPGGGGGGGRVLVQAKAGGVCPADVDAGSSGLSGGSPHGAGPASPGDPAAIGTVEGPPGGGDGEGYCFSTSDPIPECVDPSPVCDPVSGTCKKCTGPFGGGAPFACTLDVEPVCMADGSCVPCNGDFGSGATQTCQLVTSPTCFPGGAKPGSCAKCTSNADCVGPGHPGPNCNTTVGACGKPCNGDSDCASTEWCAESVCVPKTPNSQPVPNVPPVNGECTPENGQRVCLSAVCEPDDDLCGRKNGSPCDHAVDAECRSNICFPKDDECGKPNGEPCAGDGDCRSAQCENGVCTGCDDDSDCPSGQVCDGTNHQCIDGCRETDGGASNCPPPKQCSAHDGSIGQCVDPAAQPDGGVGTGGADGGVLDTTGVVEGGGCACRTNGGPASGSPVAFLAGAIAAIGLAISRRKGSRGPRQRAGRERATTDDPTTDDTTTDDTTTDDPTSSDDRRSR
jgi:hypothetical protein